ncbi:hypothetical protein SO802_010265 [Lithocarpus litseifolius]|uniref:Uncharacterized protein n=1 Tax=Lithocarpus litseifolius TaxID=425828 RepID=A0AAW2DDS2_9ROSI
MDDTRRRAIIKQQASAKKKQEGGQPSKGTGSAHSSTKRKQPEKSDRLPKKPKTVPEPVVGLKAEAKKAIGFQEGPFVTEKLPILLRKDSKYVLEQLSSIITANDYEDLSNHATEAMGEIGLFGIAQVMLMMKGLMGRCLNHETALDCVRAKAKVTEEELAELKAWKGELEKQTEVLQQVFEDKEGEIKTVKDQLRQAKEDAVREYRNFEAYLTELGDIFVNGFDDCLRQAQTSVQPIHFESTEDLFADDAPVDDPHVDGDSAPNKAPQSVEGDARQPDVVPILEERNEENPPV